MNTDNKIIISKIYFLLKAMIDNNSKKCIVYLTKI